MQHYEKIHGTICLISCSDNACAPEELPARHANSLVDQVQHSCGSERVKRGWFQRGHPMMLSACPKTAEKKHSGTYTSKGCCPKTCRTEPRPSITGLRAIREQKQNEQRANEACSTQSEEYVRETARIPQHLCKHFLADVARRPRQQIDMHQNEECSNQS